MGEARMFDQRSQCAHASDHWSPRQGNRALSDWPSQGCLFRDPTGESELSDDPIFDLTENSPVFRPCFGRNHGRTQFRISAQSSADTDKDPIS